MKHPSAETLLEPGRLGASVRSIVEAYLHEHKHILAEDFPERIEKFAIVLGTWGSKMNLTAHPNDPQEIAFHVIDCAMPLFLGNEPRSVLAGKFGQTSRVLDLGSGAGFPGLVLAAACDAHFTLVESRRKRASFLQIATADLGLTNVTIDGRRSDLLDLESQYDLVTARAFGDVSDFFAIAARALKSGGLAMLYANPSQRLGRDIQRLPYQVPRHGQLVDRILAIRRQS